MLFRISLKNSENCIYLFRIEFNIKNIIKEKGDRNFEYTTRATMDEGFSV